MNYIIDSKILDHLIKIGQEALDGDSNDDEHDALYTIVQELDSLESEKQTDSNSANQSIR